MAVTRPLVLPAVNGNQPRWQVSGITSKSGRPVVSHHATRASADRFRRQHGGTVEHYTPIKTQEA